MRAQAQQQLDAYLLRFPAEAARLAALRAQLADDEGDPLSRANMRGHVTTSALVLDPGLQQLLMIHHRVIGRWLQPGGHYEAGKSGNAAQSLWHSALREVREETGVMQLRPHAGFGDALPLDIDSHAIAANPRKGEGAHWHHDYAYLVIASPDETLAPQLSEVHGVAWRPLAGLVDSPDARLRGLRAKLNLLSP